MNITLRQNMTTEALSQYTGLFFDRGMVQLGNRVIALDCERLCELGGDTDNTEDIKATFKPLDAASKAIPAPVIPPPIIVKSYFS